MPRELKNAEITHVSYVDKPANRRKFFLTKQEEPSVEEIAEKVKEITQPLLDRIENLEKAATQKSVWSNLFVVTNPKHIN